MSPQDLMTDSPRARQERHLRHGRAFPAVRRQEERAYHRRLRLQRLLPRRRPPPPPPAAGEVVFKMRHPVYFLVWFLYREYIGARQKELTAGGYAGTPGTNVPDLLADVALSQHAPFSPGSGGAGP
jgi:hypothetical protein